MNLRIYTYIAVAFFITFFGAYWYGQVKGWSNGRAALVAEQAEQARAKLAKQTTRQQADDSKAAVANESGKAKTVTITQEVIHYVKTPGRNVCTFDADRLSIKRAAVDNANSLSGYDDAAMQTPATFR